MDGDLGTSEGEANAASWQAKSLVANRFTFTNIVFQGLGLLACAGSELIF